MEGVGRTSGEPSRSASVNAGSYTSSAAIKPTSMPKPAQFQPPSPPHTNKPDQLAAQLESSQGALYKAITCPFWSHGRCNLYEDHCLFAHVDTGQYAPTTNGRKQAKSFTCPAWRAGRCNKPSSDCLYSHQDTGLYVTFSHNVVRKHITCYYWKTAGQCRHYEEDCPYAHRNTGILAWKPVKDSSPGPNSLKSYICPRWETKKPCRWHPIDCPYSHSSTAKSCFLPTSDLRSNAQRLDMLSTLDAMLPLGLTSPSATVLKTVSVPSLDEPAEPANIDKVDRTTKNSSVIFAQSPSSAQHAEASKRGPTLNDPPAIRHHPHGGQQTAKRGGLTSLTSDRRANFIRSALQRSLPQYQSTLSTLGTIADKPITPRTAESHISTIKEQEETPSHLGDDTSARSAADNGVKKCDKCGKMILGSVSRCVACTTTAIKLQKHGSGAPESVSDSSDFEVTGSAAPGAVNVHEISEKELGLEDSSQSFVAKVLKRKARDDNLFIPHKKRKPSYTAALLAQSQLRAAASSTLESMQNDPLLHQSDNSSATPTTPMSETMAASAHRGLSELHNNHDISNEIGGVDTEPIQSIDQSYHAEIGHGKLVDNNTEDQAASSTNPAAVSVSLESSTRVEQNNATKKAKVPQIVSVRCNSCKKTHKKCLHKVGGAREELDPQKCVTFLHENPDRPLNGKINEAYWLQIKQAAYLSGQTNDTSNDLKHREATIRATIAVSETDSDDQPLGSIAQPPAERERVDEVVPVPTFNNYQLILTPGEREIFQDLLAFVNVFVDWPPSTSERVDMGDLLQVLRSLRSRVPPGKRGEFKALLAFVDALIDRPPPTSEYDTRGSRMQTRKSDRTRPQPQTQPAVTMDEHPKQSEEDSDDDLPLILTRPRNLLQRILPPPSSSTSSSPEGSSSPKGSSFLEASSSVEGSSSLADSSSLEDANIGISGTEALQTLRDQSTKLVRILSPPVSSSVSPLISHENYIHESNDTRALKRPRDQSEEGSGLLPLPSNSGSTTSTRGNARSENSSLNVVPGRINEPQRPQTHTEKTQSWWPDEDEERALDALRARGVVIETDSEEDGDPSDDEALPRTAPPLITDPLHHVRSSQNPFDVDRSLDMRNLENRYQALNKPPPWKRNRPTKKQLMGKLLLYQTRENKLKYGNPHIRVLRKSGEIPVVAIVEKDDTFDTPGHESDEQYVPMTFRDFMGMPKQPVIARGKNKEEVVFVDKPSGRDGSSAGVARTRRHRDDETFPFVYS